MRNKALCELKERIKGQFPMHAVNTEILALN